MKMRSIAFFNNKGGVGKTTLLCNVAAYLGLELKKDVLVIDADPQCNATQLLLSDEDVLRIYNDSKSFTLHSVIHPLARGKGYNEKLSVTQIKDYGVDLIPGDPRLSLQEDLLAKDWHDAVAGNLRGIQTSYLFKELLQRCDAYDYVLFDMGPSLGSINRAVLLACDYYLSPMSIDIFSLKAIENISAALKAWKKALDHGLDIADWTDAEDLKVNTSFNVQFAGYVAQQYIQKKKEGEAQAVAAYEAILKKIPHAIRKHLHASNNINYEIGKIPNLHSLIPLSQMAHKPLFSLKSKDGVRGSHFTKVSDAKNIFGSITNKLIRNIQALS